MLALSAVAPWPVGDGYRLRVSRLLAGLARERPVTLVSPAPSEGDGGVGDPLPVPSGLRWVRAEGVPASTSLPWAPERDRFVGLVREVIAERSYATAVAWAGTEFVVREIETFPPAVLDRIDCESLQLWRRRGYYGDWRRKLQTVRQDLEMLLYERRVTEGFDSVVVTSPADARALRRLSGHDRIEVLANGVDLPDREAIPPEADSPTVVFTGVLEYAPNVDAVRWFTDRVWPRVRERLPEARFVIAGRAPVGEVRALAGRPGVELRADVPDLRSEIARAWVAVAPMRSGSGVKNKVLEAWSVGRPVLMTDLAAEGLDLPEELSRCVRGDARSMAAGAVELLESPGRRRRLGEAGRRHAAARFTWEWAGDRLAELLRAAEERAGDPS